MRRFAVAYITRPMAVADTIYCVPIKIAITTHLHSSCYSHYYYPIAGGHLRGRLQKFTFANIDFDGNWAEKAALGKNML